MYLYSSMALMPTFFGTIKVRALGCVKAPLSRVRTHRVGFERTSRDWEFHWSNAVGGIIAAQLLKLYWLGVSNWRWLLILEGIPAPVGGIATQFYLTDWPKD